MRYGLGKIGVMLLVATALAGAARADLRGYVARSQPEQRWSKESENSAGAVKIINLKLRSQVWRNLPWDHSIQIFVPKVVKHPKTALLLITGGSPGLTDTALGAQLAPKLEAPLVILYNIPNQPLYDGKKEDDLIAHTFEQYLKSGDEEWPLLQPMVRSATAAMDAVQQLSRKEWETPVDGFVVTGASKRGWTTWLTAVADARVRGIAPMVFDNLNFGAQMPRQLELWGKYSEQIDDYSNRGLQQQFNTERGKRLLAIVDPWAYRKQLTLPKLLINGANDRYWATDATRLYWNDLEGEKHVLMVPNAGHGLEDRGRVVESLTAFFHSVSGDEPLPRLTHKYEEKGGKVRVSLESTLKPVSVRVWTTKATDLDFRPTKWEPTEVAAPSSGKKYQTEVSIPSAGGVALFFEAEFEQDGRHFTLSTPSGVYGKRPQP